MSTLCLKQCQANTPDAKLLVDRLSSIEHDCQHVVMRTFSCRVNDGARPRQSQAVQAIFK